MNMQTPTGAMIQPYLFFGARCEEVLEFYKSAARRPSRHADALQ